MYVVNTGPNGAGILKVDPAGQVVTFHAGGLPSGVAVDAAGNVYFADRMANVIQRIDPQGNVTSFAGSGVGGDADGPAGVAEFSSPRGLAVDSAGNVYVADSGNNRVKKIDPGGNVTTLAGDGTPG